MSGNLKLSNILPEVNDDGIKTVHASGIEELINWHHKQASTPGTPPTLFLGPSESRREESFSRRNALTPSLRLGHIPN